MGSPSEGPLRAYRIADSRFPVADGGGAALFGGRWNSPGVRVVYGSLSYAGALLERLAQAGIGVLPSGQQWIAIDVPGGLPIEWVAAGDVPGWDAADMIASRAVGDRWVREGRTAVLVVPSMVARPHERNVVLSAVHPDFARIAWSEPQPVAWDPRLLGTGNR